MLKEVSKKVIMYAQEHEGENFTTADIAEALEISARSANGSVGSLINFHKNAAGEKEPLLERVPAKIETEDGVKTVQFIRLTAAGKAFDVNAE